MSHTATQFGGAARLSETEMQGAAGLLLTDPPWPGVVLRLLRWCHPAAHPLCLLAQYTGLVLGVAPSADCPAFSRLEACCACHRPRSISLRTPSSISLRTSEPRQLNRQSRSVSSCALIAQCRSASGVPRAFCGPSGQPCSSSCYNGLQTQTGRTMCVV